MEYGWYPLLVFVWTPWFLYRLGTDHFGLWMLLIGIVSIGGALNSGTGAAVIKTVSAGLGRVDPGLVRDAIATSLAIALIAGGVLAGLLVAVSWFYGETLFSRMGETSLLRLTGIAAALLLWIEQVDNVFSSALKGAEQFGKAAAIEIASKTVQISAAAVVLVWCPDLSAFFATLVVFAAVRLLVKAQAAKKAFGLASLAPSLQGSRDILGLAKWGWLQGAGGMLFGVADRFLVGALLGATALTFYSIATQLAMQIHAATAAAVSVIFPKVSRLLAADGHAHVKTILVFSFCGSLLLSSALAGALYVFGPAILELWVGSEIAKPTSAILSWLIVAYWILAWNIAPYYGLLGMGRIRFVGVSVLASGAASVVAMYLSISHLGILGAPLGRGVFAVLTLVLALPFVVHVLNQRASASTAFRDDHQGGNDVNN